MDLWTGNIEAWTVEGSGAYGDVIYFGVPGHVGLVVKPGATFIGSQSSKGVAIAHFGPGSGYWGDPNATDPKTGRFPATSAPIFLRPCIADPHVPAPASASGGGGVYSDPFGKAWFWMMEYINAWWTPPVQPPGEVMQVGGHN
jgi:hypothetical protein